ncbi:MAG: hypothetical protein LBH90_09190 [Tannerella sp.]|nr:hypothetical protein [Tannerella sp.]
MLNCWNNHLSALDVSKNTALTKLECSGNQLSAAALDRIFTDLPNRSGMEAGEIFIINNPGTETCNRSIATAKNWNIIDE